MRRDWLSMHAGPTVGGTYGMGLTSASRHGDTSIGAGLPCWEWTSFASFNRCDTYFTGQTTRIFRCA